MKRALPIVLFLALTTGLFAQESPFTLEQIMSAPFPSELTASPTGKKVAWIQDDRGIRNIWVAEPPDYRGRQVTAYANDDGQELGYLAWTPDAKTLVYVRGGAANRSGEIPNPTSEPSPAEQAIWRISLDGGAPVRIGQGSSPAVSPGGNGLVFLRRGQIFWARLDTVREPSPLIQARGNAQSLRWSPDGSKLAFASSRGDHEFIGVYSVDTKSLKFLSPSVDSDNNPTWSTDGKSIAFIRFPASVPGPMGPRRSASPWSILVGDVESGQARVVWQAQPGNGSAFRAVVSENQLLWASDDRIVFPWEKDGWTHLYAVAAGGGEAKLLTPGGFEVEYVSLSPDRREIIYNSNQGDIDRRHLWRVKVAEGEPVAVTSGKTIEWDPVLTSDGKTLAFFRSDSRTPAHGEVLVNGKEDRELAAGTIPSYFPEKALVEPEQVIYTSADGMKIHAQLFLPPSMKKGERHPALVYMHGGSRRQMLLGWHYNYYYHNGYAMNQYLASRGYVVLSVNYRSGIGYGMEFREALHYGPAGGSEFSDIIGAGLYLKSRPDVSPEKIGLWGGSYGGYLTAMGLSRASDLFAAGVDFHGVHDWSTLRRANNPSPNPEEKSDDARTAFESSPMSSVDTWRSPVLLIHGDDDRNVAFSQTVTLVEALRKRGVDVEQLIFPDEIHDFLLHRSWVEAYRATADFFDRKLKAD
jgi:dipeptidyl aminopeptidase/acylaminoacyl peptidase